MICWRL